MTSAYLDRPLRTLEQAMRDIERNRARERLQLITIFGGASIEPVERFEPKRTFLNSPPPAGLAPMPEEDDEEAPSSLVAGERAIVSVWWCLRVLLWIVGSGAMAGAIIAGW